MEGKRIQKPNMRLELGSAACLSKKGNCKNNGILQLPFGAYSHKYIIYCKVVSDG